MRSWSRSEVGEEELWGGRRRAGRRKAVVGGGGGAGGGGGEGRLGSRYDMLRGREKDWGSDRQRIIIRMGEKSDFEKNPDFFILR